MKTLIASVSLLTILLGYNLADQEYDDGFKQIINNNMVLRYKLENGKLNCILKAPTEGWVALGFNQKDQLEGSQLFMANVVEGKSKCENRQVIAPGKYPLANNVGELTSRVIEENGITCLFLEVEVTGNSTYEGMFNKEGATYVTMAYSSSDDFAHHSRTRLKFKLKF